MLYIDQIRDLFRQLLPTGRAFRGPVNGYMDTLNEALSISENKAYIDMLSIFNDMILDNVGNVTANFINDATFGGNDASDWERRLGLIDGSGLPMATRVNLIVQQFNYPGSFLWRGNYLYVQSQLQLAGFNVFVYENRFFVNPNWISKSPLAITGGVGVDDQHGDFEHGDGVHGGVYGQIVANSILNSVDLSFYVSPDYNSTFFIGGPTLGSFAAVPAALEQQFRQLILRLKPVQAVAYLFVVYTP